MLCRELSEIKKQNKTKNKIKQNNNNKTRTIVRLVHMYGKNFKVAKYNPS